MKTPLSAVAFAATALSLSAAPVPIPNGDFSSGDTGWGTATDGPTIFDFPASGGNPGGHASIDFTTGNYAVLVSDPVSLASLGLTAGETYEFRMDMINLDGPGGVGGLKIDFPGATPASTGDINPALIGDGSTWETYSFEITLPADASTMTFVPLWGGTNTNVGYDNLIVDDTPVMGLTEIPNADFELGADSWAQDSGGGGTFFYNFPATGGNPDGHAVIDHSANDGGFGVMVSNGGSVIPLAGLGLTAGETYVFSQDMKLFSGSAIGGFKVDFFVGAGPAGSSGDMYPALIGDGSTWETYDFEIAIPLGTTGIKVVPLWGPGSVVGYDGISFDPTPLEGPAITEIPNGDFEDGSTDWAEGGAPNTTFSYPATGGNPGAYGTMTNNGTGFGIWISNGNAILPIDGLGLVAGETYNFSVDMTILSGANLGGFKVEYFNGGAGIGSTGDMFPALIGDGSTWETYTFEVTLPSGTNGIKVVPLWGAGSTVGYDNIVVDPTPVPQPPLPNGDFEDGGSQWLEIGAPDTSFSYPTTGGNPDGYGLMTNSGVGFGIWVANGGAPLSLDSLGLAPGQTVTFTQDMRIFSGSNIGGFKVEFLDGATFLGDTGDLFPSLIGDGSTWETYTFEVVIPPAADNIKVVPIAGAGSSVGFDNIGFIEPVPVPFVAEIARGTVVSWTAVEPMSIYQPQESPDGAVWSDLGGPITGNTVSSVFDADGAAFHRVIESEVILDEAVINGSFEVPDDFDPLCGEGWLCIGSEVEQLPTRITTDARTGSASMQLKVQNDLGGDPQSSELQQNIANEGGFVVPGESYDLSFWAKQINSGVSYVQQYRVVWLDDIGAEVGTGINFTPFMGGNGIWSEVRVENLMAPPTAATALIQILANTGAVADEAAAGEVLIDDFSLASSTIEQVGTLPATTSDGVEISWITRMGIEYQAKSSPTLSGFTAFGPVITGDGDRASVFDTLGATEQFYVIEEVGP